ncbi:MAG: DUF4330 domain-containing protein [Clostridia bacterium]|nr:DUF4330 domain-containing protein [Clostridia bacterium]MBQ1374728.1 DUF4330 domain-containing protein [Clostridia bacterium]
MRERQYRLFGKVGVLDIIIVVLVILGLYAAFSYAVNMDVSAANGQKQIEYGVYLTKKDAAFEDRIEIGMNVYDSLKGQKIGTIVGYDVEPYSTIQPNIVTGEMVKSSVDGYYNYIVVISASADISEATTAVGSYEVAVGKEMFLRTKTFASGGYCVTLNVVGGEG